MVITWFGLSCFKISSGDLTLVSDPFSKEVGLTPPRMQTDIVIISNNQDPAYNNRASVSRDNTFVIDGPGEFDVKGLFVHGIPSSAKAMEGKPGSTIYGIRMEDIRLGFLGALKQKELTLEQLEALGEIDILLVPVGGNTVLDPEEAVTAASQIEPRIVIPMHYEQKGLKIKLEKLEHFLKEFGTKAEPQEKLTIRKSEIAALEPKVVAFAPAR